MATLATYLLTNTGDYDTTGGTFTVVEDADAIKEQLTIRLNEFVNDWFLNLNEGIQYFEEVFGQRTITDTVENEFKLTILETQGVTGLLSIDFDLQLDRLLVINFVVSTIFGDIALSVPITL